MATRPGFGRDHNPLRRRSDRIQAYSGLAAVVLVIVVLPVALFAGWRTWQHFSVISDQELATRQLVTATVAAGDPQTRIARNHLATVTWTYPDQVAHSGHLAVPGSTLPGDLVPVWVDEAGEMTTAPMTRLNVWLDAIGIGVGLMLAALAVGGLGYQGTRSVLNRHRARELDEEWRRLNGFSMNA
ncbi:hypothetical protein GCM10027456_54040 [Kineosporia babensis]